MNGYHDNQSAGSYDRAYKDAINAEAERSATYLAYCKTIAEVDRKAAEAYKAGQYERYRNLGHERTVREYAWDTRRVILSEAEAEEAVRKRYGSRIKPVITQKQDTARRAFSRVCGIANRIPKTVSRKEAFTQAWRIVKAGGIKIPVAGVTFEDRQEALRRIALYASKNIHTLLVPEPDNLYDRNAIAVKVLAQGARSLYKIGYVPAAQTHIVKAFIGKEPEIQITGGDVFGVRLNIAV